MIKGIKIFLCMSIFLALLFAQSSSHSQMPLDESTVMNAIDEPLTFDYSNIGINFLEEGQQTLEEIANTT